MILSLTDSVSVLIVVAVPKMVTFPVTTTLPFTVPPVLSNLLFNSDCKLVTPDIGILFNPIPLPLIVVADNPPLMVNPVTLLIVAVNV